MQNKTFSSKDLSLHLPFGMILSGSSSSGKSTFLLHLVAEAKQLINPAPKSFLYCYGQYNAYVPILQAAGVAVHAGVPTDELIAQHQKPLLLILDDLMNDIDYKYLAQLFCAKSHHQHFGVVFVCQDPFIDRRLKVCRSNAQYFVICRSPNSELSISMLGRQLFPGNSKFFMSAYRQSTERPYGYLLVDLHAASNPLLRLRTNIFDSDDEKVIFIPKQDV